MSRDIGKARTHAWGSGRSCFEAGLVVAVGVEGEGSEELAGVGVDDADVEVSDEEDDGGAGEVAAEADVVHASAAAERDRSGGVDAVVADAVVGAGL
jgi:hypothetical protein